MIRVLVEPGRLEENATLELDQDEVHHLQVRRVSAGETVTLLDGHGRSAPAVMVRSGRSWQARVGQVSLMARPKELTLAVAAGDRGRFFELLSHLAELGVSRLIPLETERSRPVATRYRNESLGKARKVAREGCKQCANHWTPEVQEMISLEEFLIHPDADCWFLADQQGSRLAGIAPDRRVGWLIGPEGGFSTDEIRRIHQQLSPVPISLGPLILRYETAAMAAAVLSADRRG